MHRDKHVNYSRLLKRAEADEVSYHKVTQQLSRKALYVYLQSILSSQHGWILRSSESTNNRFALLEILSNRTPLFPVY